MCRHEFMAHLYNALKNLSPQEREDILNDYEEHFRIGLEMGKSEAEIADSLGSPEELAASFTEDAGVPLPKKEILPGPEDYGDSRRTDVSPYDQNVSQHADYYEAQTGRAGTYDSSIQSHSECERPHPRIGMAVLLVCLTLLLVIPAGVPCFLAILAAIIALAFTAGWFGVSMLVFYGSTAAWLIAGIALLCLCACLALCLIAYISGSCKLAVRFVRFFVRTVFGRKGACS